MRLYEFVLTYQDTVETGLRPVSTNILYNIRVIFILFLSPPLLHSIPQLSVVVLFVDDFFLFERNKVNKLY